MIDVKSEVQKRIEGFRELYEKVKRKIAVAHDRARNVYNLRRRQVEFQPGDFVWRKNKAHSDGFNYYAAKLAPKYVGPFTVKRKMGYCTYQLQDKSGTFIGNWHVQDLKPYNACADP